MESHGQLRKDHAALRRDLDDRNRRIRTLDTELLASNQRRQDAYKRIDELIAHLNQLDEQLEESGE